MKVGDLVHAMSAKMGSKIRLGVIIKRIKPPTADNWLEIFEVMTLDGEIMTYTTTALRVVK